jgi:anti-sigma regulatory factor (Ser/Thr protein kinase)
MEIRVPAGPEGAWLARQKLAHLERRLDRRAMDNLRLLVSELVTNSIRHAGLATGTVIEVGVRVRPRQIRVEVTDPGPGFDPKPVTPSFYQTGGWGLYLVEQLSDRWGVIRGKATTVWFELGGVSAKSGVAASTARA